MAGDDDRLDACDAARAQVDLRLIPQLEPGVGDGLVEPGLDRGCKGDGDLGAIPEGHAGDRLPYRIGAKRLLQGQAHVEPAQGADAMHIVEQGRLGAAHQLHDPAIAHLAERTDDVDGVGAAEVDVEEDDLGLAALEGCDRRVSGMEALGRQSQLAERGRQVSADADLVVDHERIDGRLHRQQVLVPAAAPGGKRIGSGLRHGVRLPQQFTSFPRAVNSPSSVKDGLKPAAQCNRHLEVQ